MKALGVLLGRGAPELAALGLAGSAARATAKIVESLPDTSRGIAQRAGSRFRLLQVELTLDERVPALADAVRRQRIVRIRSRGPDPRTIHPVGLTLAGGGWEVVDGLDPSAPIPVAECEAIDVSSRTFAVPPFE